MLTGATAPALMGFAMADGPPAPEPVTAEASLAEVEKHPFEIGDLATGEVAEEITEADVVPPAEPSSPAVEASFYGKGFAGKPTANGETFDPAQMTAAHRTLPFGSMVKVTDAASGKSVTVRINDRGPFHGNRAIDLSEGAARALGMIGKGTAKVHLDVLG